MGTKHAIVDLFAGPGGLGEGFHAAGRAGRDMEIALSVEMDRHAVATLRLRSFLRRFEDAPPAQYAEAINAGKPFPDWADLYPQQWDRANREVRQLVLGSEGAFDVLADTLDHLRERHYGDTILIGGPPCQAYSLVGRSRNRGKADYRPEDDARHFLYREYVRILDRLRPSAFVMENVKGMISSRVHGGAIFERVLEDLSAAGDGYRLLPLSGTPTDGDPKAADFVVRAERHGVPQARHRVFVVGIRRDLAQRVWNSLPILPERDQPSVGVAAALSGLQHLRSGLSRTTDEPDLWREAVFHAARRIISSEADEAVRERINELLSDGLATVSHRVGYMTRPLGNSLEQQLADWLGASDLSRPLNHETRSHIPSDLGRYLHAAVHAEVHGISPKLEHFPGHLQPAHRNRHTGAFADRFRVQLADRPASTVTSHIAKDGHYYIHPDPRQCRSLTVREAARLQTFPDDYIFCGPRTEQYRQVGNAVPPYLAFQIAQGMRRVLSADAPETSGDGEGAACISATA